jgi:hypothetical protein
MSASLYNQILLHQYTPVALLQLSYWLKKLIQGYLTTDVVSKDWDEC